MSKSINNSFNFQSGFFGIVDGTPDDVLNYNYFSVQIKSNKNCLITCHQDNNLSFANEVKQTYNYMFGENLQNGGVKIISDKINCEYIKFSIENLESTSGSLFFSVDYRSLGGGGSGSFSWDVPENQIVFSTGTAPSGSSSLTFDTNSSTLFFNNASGGSLTASNLSVSDSLTTNNLFFSSALGGSLTASNLSVSDSLTTNNLFFSSASGGSLTANNLFFTSASGGSLTANNLSFTNSFFGRRNDFWMRGYVAPASTISGSGVFGTLSDISIPHFSTTGGTLVNNGYINYVPNSTTGDSIIFNKSGIYTIKVNVYMITDHSNLAGETYDQCFWLDKGQTAGTQSDNISSPEDLLDFNSISISLGSLLATEQTLNYTGYFQNDQTLFLKSVFIIHLPYLYPFNITAFPQSNFSINLIYEC